MRLVVDFLFFVMRAGVFICSFGAGVLRDAVICCTHIVTARNVDNTASERLKLLRN